MVQLLPLKYYLFMIKASPKYLLPENDKPQAIRLARKTMRRVVRFAPWHCTCLVKSITLKNLLNGLGVESDIAFSIIRRNNSDILSHSYIKKDNKIIYLRNIGFPELCELRFKKN